MQSAIFSNDPALAFSEIEVKYLNLALRHDRQNVSDVGDASLSAK